jgi:hypothetical protein
VRASSLLLSLAALAGPVSAAEPPPDPVRLRDELRAMEALLDSTVEQVSRPNPGFMLAGSPTCRGYLLKGYGFVFVLPARWLPVRSAGLRPRRPGTRGSSTESMIVVSSGDPGLRELEIQVQKFQEEIEHERADAEHNFDRMLREIRQRNASGAGEGPAVPPNPARPVSAPAAPVEAQVALPAAAASPAEPSEPPAPPEPPRDLAPPPPAGPVAPWWYWVAKEPEDQGDTNPERLVGDVRDAVIAALEAHGPSLSSLRPEETISVVVDFVAGAPFLDDDARPARSLTLRVRKRDLDDRRAGRLSAEELRHRVEAVEY